MRATFALFFLLLASFSLAQEGDNWNFRATMGHNATYGLGPRASTRFPTSSSQIYGYDISQFQGSVNFSQLAAGSSFVVIREGYGAGNLDKNFAVNRNAAEAQGMETGFYHYAYPEYNTPDAEATSFCNNIGTLNTGEFVCLDFEESYSGDVVGWCKTWMDDVYARLGVRPLLYINLNTEKGYDWTPVVNGNYGLWLAYWDFNKTAAAPATQWSFVAMRQYSDSESAPGISGNVDGDVFYGSLTQLKKYGKASSVPLSTLKFLSSSVQGGNSVIAEVTLGAKAGGSGAVVSLSSSSPDIIYPSSVTVPAGQNYYYFTVGTAKVAASETVSLTASLTPISKSANLTLTPPPPIVLSQLKTTSGSVTGGQAFYGEMVLSAKAASGGVTVQVQSSSSDATVPSTVTVPAGQNYVYFVVHTLAVSSTEQVTITATASNSVHATVTLNP